MALRNFVAAAVAVLDKTKAVVEDNTLNIGMGFSQIVDSLDVPNNADKIEAALGPDIAYAFNSVVKSVQRNIPVIKTGDAEEKRKAFIAIGRSVLSKLIDESFADAVAGLPARLKGAGVSIDQEKFLAGLNTLRKVGSRSPAA